MDILNSIAEFIGQATATYNKYLNRENAKTREEIEQKKINDALSQANQDSLTIQQIFYRALQNCASTINANVPKYDYQCVAKPHIAPTKSGLIVWRFRFYSSGLPNKPTVERIINYELMNECYMMGLPFLYAHVKFIGTCQVLVQVAWQSDCERVANNAKK